MPPRVAAIHGDMDQHTRMATLADFKAGACPGARLRLRRQMAAPLAGRPAAAGTAAGWAPAAVALPPPPLLQQATALVTCCEQASATGLQPPPPLRLPLLPPCHPYSGPRT